MLNKTDKIRLDLFIVQNGLLESRESAKRFILAGKVKVNGLTFDKPGVLIKSDSSVEIDHPDNRFVSRGGLKLEGAIKDFSVDVSDMVCVDFGASTGGFCDCLLHYNAKKIYAIDVGYGQFSWKLRNDPRIVLMEKFNARYLKPENIPEKADLAVMDVSFISSALLWQNVKDVLKPGGIYISLVKPQFEAGKDKVPKGGVIKDKQTHYDVLFNLLKKAYDFGWIIESATFSHLKGAEGNREYWFYLRKPSDDTIRKSFDETIVELKLDVMIENAFNL